MSKVFLFDRSRTPSPEVFQNNLSDFEEESEDEVETIEKVSKANKFQTAKTTDFPGNKSKSSNVKAIIKPNFTNRHLKNDRSTPNVLPVKTPGKTSNESGPVPEVDRKIRFQDNFIRKAKKPEHGASTKAVSLETEDTVDDSDLKNQKNFDSWIKTWTLDDEDLLEKRAYVDPTIKIDPSLTKSAEIPIPKGRKIRWTKNQRYPRIYHTRSSRKSLNDWKTKYQQSVSKLLSPLTILANYAAEHNKDIPEFLESCEKKGFNESMLVRFPCMQCYEKKGTRSNPMEYLFGGSSESYYDEHDEDKCKKCGGKIQTMNSFIKMLMGLKTRIQANDFVVYDVYPDGNCLFGAVVDQLRIRGVFSYNIQNLRQASVDYLREHPISSDGETHFQLFLTDETWEQYLSRMSKDGEWGDHMILSAISNVTHQRIVIFGGREGEGQTIILPTDMQEPIKKTGPEPSDENQENKAETGRRQDHDNGTDTQTDKTDKDNSDIKRGHGKDKTDKDTDHNAATSDDDDEDDSKDTNDAESKLDESKDTKKAEETFIHDRKGTIFLGHFGESHYVSLRPRDWEDNFLNPERNKDQQEDENGDQELEETTASTLTTKISLDHLNFFLLQFLQFEYLSSAHAKQIDFVAIKGGSKEAKEEGVGKMINKLDPCFDHIQTLSPDVGIFLPAQKIKNNADKHAEGIDEKQICTFLHIPNDTIVREQKAEAKKFDLIGEEVKGSPDLVRLIPCRPEKWKEKSKERNGLKYLLAINPFQDENKLMSFAKPWPRHARSWSKRARPAMWPDVSTLETIEKTGCHVIPMVHAAKFDDFREDYYCGKDDPLSDELLWGITFTLPEREIAASIPTVQRNIFFLFQLLTEYILQDSPLPKVVCKHICFYACENVRKLEWEANPGTCLLILLKKLSDSLKCGFLPHYFMQSKNLLQDIPPDSLQMYQSKVDLTRNRPMILLYYLLDQNKITATEVGSFMDIVIEDMFRYQIHGDLYRSIMESFLPACCGLVESFIYQGEYQFAVNTILCLKEELDKTDGDIPDVSEIVCKGLWNMHEGYRWCFAFYYDMKQNTLISKDLTKGIPSVPITDIFGPEITSVLPNTIITKTLSVPYGELHFPLEIAKVLKSAGYTQVLPKCLRYYLDTYYDIFGSPAEYPPGPTYGGLLFNLYITLFNSYQAIGETEEFKDLLPRLVEVGEYLGTQSAVTEVENVYTVLEGKPIKMNLNRMPKSFAFTLLKF